jgi:hypothetical protein
MVQKAVISLAIHGNGNCEGSSAVSLAFGSFQ